MLEWIDYAIEKGKQMNRKAQSGESACPAAKDGGGQRIEAGTPKSRDVQPALLAELRKELNERREAAGAMAHLIVEAGLVPGIDVSCRCDECRSVAVSMDEAGYMTHVKDRWWESE